MTNLTKKLSFPAVLTCTSAVLAIVALIVAVVSCSGEGFSMDQLPIVAAGTAAAALLCAGVLAISLKRGDGVVSSVLMAAMVLALGLCIYEMVMGKSDVFGTVIFSDLEKGYAPAEQASTLGLVSIVLYLVSAVVACVGSFGDFSVKRG